MELVEILSALRHCTSDLGCDTCPMRAGIEQRAFCVATLLKESKTAITDLLAGIDASKRRCAQAQAERDALREKVPQWISVDDRHPKPGTRVLATNGVFVEAAYRTSADTWRRYDGIAMRDCIGSVVTHWMPLPEAPKFADVLRGAPEAPEGEKT